MSLLIRQPYATESAFWSFHAIKVWVDHNKASLFASYTMECHKLFNSLAPGRPRCHFRTTIFNLVLLTGIFTSSKDNALRWMPWDLTDDKSTLVQVMAWCRQATSHYLSQCWPSSMSPYGVTRPQWVNFNHKMHCSCIAEGFLCWFVMREVYCLFIVHVGLTSTMASTPD